MEIFIQLTINSIIAGSIYALIALGFNLIFGVSKFFDLGYGTMAVVGGYSVLYFGKMLGWNIFLSILIGVILAGLIGFLINKFIYQTLRQRKASNLVLIIASLGVFTVIQAVTAMLFSSQFQTLSQNIGQNTYNIFGGIITQIQLIILMFTIVIMLALAWMMKKTMFGKAIKAVGDDEEVAKIVGIDTNKIIAYVFFIGSAIAGLAGILIGFDTGLEPIMGMKLILKGVVASIIGGVGNVYGGVAGAFFLGFIENFGIWKLSGEWREAIAFVVLILFLLFRPRGIFKK
ncbi:MAG: branched-chain amino acid ABC transporter permease [Candidatus Pacebacteria bacterium]|nr:branched-chain amino acid ABC transporter permease [Candidatus Paceibacterota bacterium]